MSKSLVVGSLADVSQKDGTSIAETFMNADVIIVLDTSGSMSSRDAPGGKTRHDAAEAELRRLQSTMPGRCAVVCFSSIVQFSPSGRPIRFGGGTAMAKALEFIKPVDGLGMRMFLVSDGEPNSPSETIAIARSFSSRIDTVYIGPEMGPGRGFLERLASATGGQFAESTAPGMLAEPVLLMLGKGSQSTRTISL